MNQEILNQLYTGYPELKASCDKEIVEAYNLLVECFKKGGQLLTCGNGGSAADCEHIVGELMKGFMLSRPISSEMRCKIAAVAGEHAPYISDNLQGSLPAISLVSHTALATAFANDVAPDLVFAQQVFGYGRSGDVLIGISTSGNSPNVLHAIRVAKALGVKTIGLTGESGGAMNELCDVTIRVPYTVTPKIQERHLPIYHTICTLIEEEFFE